MDFRAQFCRTQELVARGALDEALENSRALAQRDPADPRVWQLLSTVHAHAGQLQEAVECARHALSLAPNDWHALLWYGQTLALGGRRREPLEVADRLAAGAGLSCAERFDAIGTLLTYCEEPLRARAFFERAVALAPDNTGYRFNLASAQRMTGEVAAAESHLDAVISAAPGEIRAYYTRSDLRTQTPEHNHVDEMIALLNQRVPGPRDEALLCFALAKELEDLRRYDEAWEYHKRACDLRRNSQTYAVDADLATIDRIIQTHDRSMIEGSGGGVETDECIFVFGLPRSGTTLVERILSSHSAVQATGESPAFPAETVKAVQKLVGRPVTKLEFAARALETDPGDLGRAYLDAARPDTRRSPRFVDKQPLNYLYAGLIRRALPRARMVALARDPMDSCYAMYKTPFSGAYPFSYDLLDLGRYYITWHRLMRHWQSVLGRNLLIVQYEDLVQNQREVTGRILAHCGLPWEERCLAFHAQDGAVTSASATQVRKAMYSSSVGKWRHYERQLAPLAQLIDRLEPPGGWRFS